MDQDQEITEVPLSNREVLKVLKERKQENDINSIYKDMMIYLDLVIKENEDIYPLEILRDVKIAEKLDADLNTLAILSNTNDLSILSSSDKKRIVKHFKE